MNAGRVGKALLFTLLVTTRLALRSERIAAQSYADYSPYAGTWRLSGVREKLTLALNGTTVMGSIRSSNGAKAPIISGMVRYPTITFTVESPDGQRTITFQGTLNLERTLDRRNISFKRAVSIHDGGARGENGIFGARGPNTFTATLLETRGSLAGRVVDESSGKPLRNALIEIRRINIGDDVRTTAETDAGGAFAFRNIPAGDYNLTVTMAHYQSRRYGDFDSHGIPHGIGVNAGEHIEGLDLELTKGSVISGTIRDENSSPVANAPVVAFVRKNSDGWDWDRLEIARKGAFQMPRSYLEEPFDTVVHGATDAQGRYQLEDLGPGEYYIRARKPTAPDLGFSGRTTSLMMGPRRCDRPDDAAPGPIEEADVPLFYPGATDPARVNPVRVVRGVDIPGIDFVLGPALLGSARISIRRPAGNDGVNESSPAATIALVGAGLRLDSQQPPVFCATEVEGTAEIKGVVPGAYKLIATTIEGNRRLAAIENVEITQASTAVTLNLKRGVDVRGQLHLNDNAPRDFDPSRVRVSLGSVDRVTVVERSSDSAFVRSVNLADSAGIVNADGSFVLRDVIPGVQYRLGYSGLNQQAGISGFPTARYGSTTVAETLTVETENATLDVFVEAIRVTDR